MFTCGESVVEAKWVADGQDLLTNAHFAGVTKLHRLQRLLQTEHASWSPHAHVTMPHHQCC